MSDKAPKSAKPSKSAKSPKASIKTPLALAKEQFGDKAKLVAAVEAFTTNDLWVSRTNKDKGLKHVSNAKLLRLYRTFTQVKEKFGTRAKLIDAILDLLKRTKDAGYRQGLEAFPVPRLYDLYRSTERRQKMATAPGKAAKHAATTANRPPVAQAKTAAAGAPAASRSPAPAKKAAAPKKAASKSKK